MNLSIEPTLSGKQKQAETAPVRKFMFDRCFDDASVVHRAPERKPVLMKPDQIDALKQESRDAGFAEGKAAGLDEQTAHLMTVLAQVDRNITALIQGLQAVVAEQEDQTRHLALAIAKKIVPVFVAQNGFQEIEALIGDTIREMAREPRLVVRVHEAEFDVLDEKIQTIAAQRAYSGKVVVLTDPEIAAGDCRIEWADGGVARDTQATWQAIEQTVLPS